PAPAAAGAAGTPSSPAPSRADLRRALDSGSLDDVVSILGAMGGVSGLEAVHAHLADAAQRDALRAMQAARWSQTGGDVAQARQALRRAFHDGPHWRAPPAAENTVLPPLYPSGR
ncbi:MAG: BatD family protein, partial [Stenotrophomonas sp.]